MLSAQSVLSVEKAQGDNFNQQFQRFDVKYGKNVAAEDDLLLGLKDLFNTSSQDVQISSDERLFLDRCESFIQKKYESVE